MDASSIPLWQHDGDSYTSLHAFLHIFFFAKYAVFFLFTQDLWYTFGTARRCEGSLPTTCPASCWEKKSFRSTYLKGCGRKGHERISAGYFLLFLERMISNTKPWGSQEWWCIPIVPAHGRLREDDQEFKATLGSLVSSIQTAWNIWGPTS